LSKSAGPESRRWPEKEALEPHVYRAHVEGPGERACRAVHIRPQRKALCGQSC
jgi:hypothetical protein